MIHFEWPWLLAVLPLPALIRWLLPVYSVEQQAALKVPFLDDFADGSAPSRAVRQTWPFVLAAVAWCLLVVASARPQWLGEPIEQAVSGRDLMLAVDLSGSMEQQDFVIGNR
ncbi:MAG: BatB protein, partial [Gammaproteobacteria bacterium]